MGKKKKKKIRFGGFIVLLLAIYLLVNLGIYIYKMPIKRIVINGNTYLKDNYIINYLDINKNSIINVSKSKIKNKLKEIDLISDVKIRKNYLGTLYIDIVEDKVLFYNLNTKKIVLSSQKEIESDNNYLGIPTLINYVPEDILKEFVDKFIRISKDNISLISEIEYAPSIINEKVVDDKRFLFRMNDGNIVYINTINIEKYNNYLEIYEALINKNGETNGCLYLDSNSENKHFNICDEITKRSNNSGE